MQHIVIHEVPFNIDDSVEITHELRERLTKAAIDHIHVPMAISPRHPPTAKYRYNYRPTCFYPGNKNAPRVTVKIGGIDATILRLGDPPVDLNDQDIEIAKTFWLTPAYVGPDDDGNVIVDFY